MADTMEEEDGLQGEWRSDNSPADLDGLDDARALEDADLLASPTDGDNNDNLWLIELDVAMADGCDLATLKSISKNRPVSTTLRPAVWQVCLNVVGKADQLSNFDQLFDLPEQPLVREDCHSLVEKLGNEEDEKLSVASDLESIVTFYCKSRDVSYEREGRWTELLQPMLALGYSRADLYNAFYALLTKYIPKDCRSNGRPFHLFRLLLLYHDPELCGFLDTKRISMDLFAQSWFSTLFASSCNLRVILNMWDVYLQQSDPFLVFFLALVILVNARDQLLVMQSSTKQEILDKLNVFPSALEAEDIEDFCSLALYYESKTPQSFRQDFQSSLFGTSLSSMKTTVGCLEHLTQALCLPVSSEELIHANRPTAVEGVKYFLVDCRPADQYNSGHLPTAFHLDANLMLQSPAEFSTAVQALLATQERAISSNSLAGGDHLCFMGSGREAEDQYAFMVIAHFLQRRTPYVSVCRGGYAAIHDSLGEDAAAGLAGHDPRLCIVCNPDSSAALSANQNGYDGSHNSMEPSLSDKFEKLSHVVKSTSAIVKEKMINYIKNEQGLQVERHVSSEDRVGKRYRNMASVFTIDDDEEMEPCGPMSPVQSPSDEERKPTVDLEAYLKRPEILSTFDCQEVDRSGATHVRLSDHTARIHAQRDLSTILKITSKKRHPEFITLKYGSHEASKGLVVTAVDRFVIPRAGEATKCIKQQIMKILDAVDT